MDSKKDNKRSVKIDIDDPITAVFFTRLVDNGLAKVEEDPSLGEQEIHAVLEKRGKSVNLVLRVHSLGFIGIIGNGDGGE